MSRKHVIGFFGIGLAMAGSVGLLPAIASKNNWDAGEFMVWLEESALFNGVNRLFGSKHPATTYQESKDSEERNKVPPRQPHDQGEASDSLKR